MNKNIKKKELRDFAFLLSICFPLIFGLLIPLINGHYFRYWTLFLSFPLFLIGIYTPRILFYPYRIWIKIGDFLGFINSHIILGFVYIIVLQPISFIMKLMNYDPLRKNKTKDKTYRENRKSIKIDLKRIF